MEEKRKEGRPSKITPNLIQALNEVLVEKKILIMNDQDLVMFVNEKLEEDEQISNSSFAHWKGMQLPDTNADANVVKEFLHIIKKALYTERDNLMTKMQQGKDPHWARYAWIIERKFEEWNLRTITDNRHRFPDKVPITVTAEEVKQISDLLDNEL
jgi:hypothetical protein